jgi:hypothetical protein
MNLYDVVYPRILCPVDGWRDRKPEEYQTLSEAQKTAFVDELGYKRRRQTKAALAKYIDNPRLHDGINHDIGDQFLKRMTWQGDRFILVGRQDAAWDSNWVVGIIRNYL